MAKLSIKKGSTSILCRIFIQDSSSITGAGLAGLVFNTSSLVCYRGRDDDGNAGGTQITLASATLGTWTSGGFKEKDATNMPGWYEFGIPDNALATGSRSVSIHFKGATNMAPLPLEIELTGVDNQDAVRFGLSSLPNAAAEAAGGLYTRGTGAGQIEQEDNGKISINVKQWLRGTIPAVNVTGVPIVDDKYLLGTIYSTPATAGIMDVNVKNISNSLASASGTVTFPNDTIASSTQAVAIKADTAAIKAKTDSITATVAGLIDANVVDWKGSAAVAMTGDAFARLGVAGVGLTNLGDTRIANLDATITSRMATFSLPTNFSSTSIDSNGRVKTQTNIAKNAALAKFQFVMRDDTSHAPSPGKVITVTRSIDNGTHAAGTLSVITEIGFGTYSVDFASGDLNGNVVVLRATAAGCDDTFERIVTTP